MELLVQASGIFGIEIGIVLEMLEFFGIFGISVEFSEFFVEFLEFIVKFLEFLVELE